MTLVEALETWLGPLGPNAKEGASGPQDLRMLFLGAGFSRAADPEAPLFDHLKREALVRFRAWLDEQPPGEAIALRSACDRPCEPADLFEALQNHQGSLEVVRTILSEPAGARLRLHARGGTPAERSMAADEGCLYRTLKSWLRSVALRHTHLEPLAMDGPPVIVGRLVAEGVVDLLLSSNWDALLELGCALAGLKVIDEADSSGTDPGLKGPSHPAKVLRVYDRPFDVMTRPRPAGSVLLKLHGGVRTLTNILRDVASGLPVSSAEQRLHGAFLIAATDLHVWAERAEWVQHVVRDSLAGRRSMFLGVSFLDSASFGAVRSHLREWERTAGDLARLPCPGTTMLSDPSQDDLEPAIVALSPGDSLRIRNAVTFRVSSRSKPAQLRTPVVAMGGEALAAALAWHFVGRLVRALDRELVEDRAIASRLRTLLEVDLAALAGWRSRGGSDLDRPVLPLVDLIVRVIVPSSRWAAIAEGERPFADGCTVASQGGGFGDFAPWWHAPWASARHATPDRTVVPHLNYCSPCSNLRLLADFCAHVASHPGRFTVPRSGEWIEVDAGTGRDRRIAPWPWPWAWRRGIFSSTLLITLQGPMTASLPPTDGSAPALTICPIATPWSGDPDDFATVSAGMDFLLGDRLCRVVGLDALGVLLGWAPPAQRVVECQRERRAAA